MGGGSEVGRQPWIVYGRMRVEDAATGNTGVWITFLAVTYPVRGTRRDDDPGPPGDEPPVPPGRDR